MKGLCWFWSIRPVFKALFLSSLMLCLAWTAIPKIVSSQPVLSVPVRNPVQLVQAGVLSYQSGDYLTAIAQWEKALINYPEEENPQNAAIIHENLARTLQQVGQPQKAIRHWQTLVQLYRQLNRPHKIGHMLTEEAQAYIQIGQPQKAITLLCNDHNREICTPNSALHLAQNQKDRQGEIAALGVLGDAYRERGQYDRAINHLETGLALAQEQNFVAYEATILLSLGNAHIDKGQANDHRAKATRDAGLTFQATKLAASVELDYQTALSLLQRSVTLAQQQKNTLAQINALRAIISVSSHFDQSEADRARSEVMLLLPQLPATQEKVFAMIDLATPPRQSTSQTYQDSPNNCASLDSLDSSSQPQRLLQEAFTAAKSIQDRRGQSFALGELGHLYECQDQYSQAFAFTQKARLMAEEPHNQDSLYLWEWQMGRILNAQGQETEAIRTYEQAIATLEKIRSSILSANRELQFDFRDTVSPIYRELAELHLKTALPVTSKDPRTVQTNIRAALNTVDSLKLAELQDYFGNDCVITHLPQTSVDLTARNQGTAVVNTLILGDRTAVILTLPDGSQKLSWIQASSADIRDGVITYRRGLERFFEPYQPQVAQQLYDWILRPFEADLTAAQVQTLIFVQDGIFRSVPMAALHDGQQFLIQKYAVGTTLSLSLTNPPSLNRRKSKKILALGITEQATIGDQTFPALEYVDQEVRNIKSQRPKTRILLNQDFTRDRLQKELQQHNFPIVHIATHAQFSQDPDESFLVIGDNNTLTIRELDALLRQTASGTEAIELLALTACQTAVGDDRAALGIAGVAIQAGARSAIASLWSINDAATADLMGNFYKTLQTPANKAKALQTAQLDLLNQDQFSHPAYWAPFILIGNWL